MSAAESLANEECFLLLSQGEPHGRLCPDRGVGGADFSLLARLRPDGPLNGRAQSWKRIQAINRKGGKGDDNKEDSSSCSFVVALAVFFSGFRARRTGMEAR